MKLQKFIKQNFPLLDIFLKYLKTKDERYKKYFLIELYDRYQVFMDDFKGVDFQKKANNEELGLDKDIANVYEGSKLFEVEKVLNDMELEGKVFADFGCGKGRIICNLDRYKFRKVYGIELSEEMFKSLIKNIETIKPKNLEVFEIDARKLDSKIYDDIDVIYIYHPFPEPVFRDWLILLEESLKRRKRELTIIYFNNIFESILLESGTFKEVKEYDNAISFVKTKVYKSEV